MNKKKIAVIIFILLTIICSILLAAYSVYEIKHIWYGYYSYAKEKNFEDEATFYLMGLIIHIFTIIFQILIVVCGTIYITYLTKLKK